MEAGPSPRLGGCQGARRQAEAWPSPLEDEDVEAPHEAASGQGGSIQIGRRGLATTLQFASQLAVRSSARACHSSSVIAKRRWSSQTPLISRYRSASPSQRTSSFSTTRRLLALRGTM